MRRLHPLALAMVLCACALRAQASRRCPVACTIVNGEPKVSMMSRLVNALSFWHAEIRHHCFIDDGTGKCSCKCRQGEQPAFDEPFAKPGAKTGIKPLQDAAKTDAAALLHNMMSHPTHHLKPAEPVHRAAPPALAHDSPPPVWDENDDPPQPDDPSWHLGLPTHSSQDAVAERKKRFSVSPDCSTRVRASCPTEAFPSADPVQQTKCAECIKKHIGKEEAGGPAFYFACTLADVGDICEVFEKDKSTAGCEKELKQYCKQKITRGPVCMQCVKEHLQRIDNGLVGDSMCSSLQLSQFCFFVDDKGSVKRPQPPSDSVNGWR